MSTETEDQLARLCERQRERIAVLEKELEACRMVSLRDYLAGHALSGFLARCSDPRTIADNEKHIAVAVYVIADAMLEAREQK